METNRKSVHILMVPMVQQAHVVTGVRFAKKLSKRGVIVTLTVLKQHADELNRIYTLELLQKLGIHVMTFDTFQEPKIPTPLFFSAALRSAFQPIAEKLIENKKAGLPGPTCVIADRFLYWMRDVAKELEIPRYSYASNAALVSRLLLAYHEVEDVLRAIPHGADWSQRKFEVLRKLPGLEFLKKDSDLPETTIANGWFDFFCDIGRALSDTDGIVFNSFDALEHETIQQMRNAKTGRDNAKVVPVYPIGPLSTPEEFKNETFIVAVENSHEECLEWLRTQSPRSVLYVCLGSQVRLFGEQISHIARALERSQHAFLWVLAKGRGNFNTVDEVLPAGFLQRVSGRGKVVTGWVGQLQILSNPAVGGFLSHCGWQSIIESLTCGVPILGWPQVAEQRLNCRYIEDVLKVGMRITEKEPAEIVEQHEFEEAIKTFMSAKGRAVIAANAVKAKSMAAAAIADGGPSDLAVDQLVRSFCSHL